MPSCPAAKTNKSLSTCTSFTVYPFAKLIEFSISEPFKTIIVQPLLFDNPKNITCLSEKSLCCNEKIDSTSPEKSNSAYILGIIPPAEEKTPPRPS